MLAACTSRLTSESSSGVARELTASHNQDARLIHTRLFD
jgi:hypothetical protein